MKDKPLEVIGASLIEAGEFLRLVEGDSKKMKCLEVFAKSLEVVEWIRNETKGITMTMIFSCILYIRYTFTCTCMYYV
jgi:hypothetical protein